MVLAILLFIGSFVLTCGTLRIISAKPFPSRTFIVVFDIFEIVIMILAGMALL